MSPEELEKARFLIVESHEEIKEETMRALLAHIDVQAAQISDLKRQIIELSDSVVREESRKDKQIEALKEKLITETAYHLYYKCQGDCCRMICSAGSHKEEARQQLMAEMPEVEWE